MWSLKSERSQTRGKILGKQGQSGICETELEQMRTYSNLGWPPTTSSCQLCQYGCPAGGAGAHHHGALDEHHGAKHSSGLSVREIKGQAWRAMTPAGTSPQPWELTEKLMWTATESYALHWPLKHKTKMTIALILLSNSHTICLHGLHALGPIQRRKFWET